MNSQQPKQQTVRKPDKLIKGRQLTRFLRPGHVVSVFNAGISIHAQVPVVLRTYDGASEDGETFRLIFPRTDGSVVSREYNSRGAFMTPKALYCTQVKGSEVVYKPHNPQYSQKARMAGVLT